MDNQAQNTQNPDVCLYCESIDKIYPGTKALDDVSFEVKTGKVNVLIGENGAGKSTLMKIVAGIESPSSGKIIMDGKEISFKDTAEARAMGIGIIHQELSLFPNLNVYQNIFMANEHTRGKTLLDNNEHIKLAKKVLAKLEYPIDPNTIVGDLRVGQQQMVEIARNLVQEGLRILIMDEPTSSLSSQEVEVLFKIINELKASGISIVYISHRLEEIMRIGDYVTILRDGKKVAEDDVKNISVGWIVQNMIGSDKTYTKKQNNTDFSKEETVLKVEDLCLPKRGGGWLLNHVSFALHKGEILGIYGLLGAGRTEIFECIMGMRPEHTGKFYLHGKEMKIGNISEQIAKGFALVPEDRQREGLVQTLNIGKNISLSSMERYAKTGVIDRKTEFDAVKETIKDIHIKVADPTLPILSLSGGNQQKVVIGKGILTDPHILLMDEPSRGIDVGAKAEVFDIINQCAERGLSIIVISSELKEIVAIADRIIVLSNGLLTGEFSLDEINEQTLVTASYKGHVRA
nr:sugar ABC transporter ATP-binding protein [uncultured Caproiciproducens sp.]